MWWVGGWVGRVWFGLRPPLTVEYPAEPGTFLGSAPHTPTRSTHAPRRRGRRWGRGRRTGEGEGKQAKRVWVGCCARAETRKIGVLSSRLVRPERSGTSMHPHARQCMLRGLEHATKGSRPRVKWSRTKLHPCIDCRSRFAVGLVAELCVCVSVRGPAVLHAHKRREKRKGKTNKHTPHPNKPPLSYLVNQINVCGSFC